MKTYMLRRHERFSGGLPVIHAEAQDKAVLVSFSAGGGAIRTTTRIALGAHCTLLLKSTKLRAAVVWEQDDYRIDTFYSQGLKWLEPLPDGSLLELIEAENRMKFRFSQIAIA